MTPFHPITNHVNEDRRYFIDGDQFVKWDSNLGRSRHEADVLSLLDDAWYAPSLISAWVEPEGGKTLIGTPSFVMKESNRAYHCIRMSRKPGDTLENLKASLTLSQKRAVIEGLLGIAADLLKRNIVHGDMNESNVLFDPVTYKVSLIDWETAIIGEELTDIYGPQYGLMDLLERIR